MVIHRPLWGQALWQDLWELGHQKQITVYHVTRHALLGTPGNDEADTLAKVQWLETVLLVRQERKLSSGYTIASYMLDRRSYGPL